jgi:acyl-CoA synthetase (AMP-forming)/AMP-acid ligase II
MLFRSTRSQFDRLLDARALSADETPALIYVQTGRPDRIISRAEFTHQVKTYAAGLADHGIQPRDLVIIAHLQSLDSIYAFWGAVYLGAIPSMFPTLTEKLDADLYIKSMAQLVALSGVRAIFTHDAFAPQLAAQVSCPVLSTTQLVAYQHVSFPSPYQGESDEVVFLQHSSGTTGLQKGVALSHSAVLNQLASYSESLELSAQDIIVSWLPLYHDMGLIAGFILPLIQGIPLVLMSPFDWVANPALLFQAIDRYHGTLCWLPNFAYNHSARRIRDADLASLSLAHMRAFINCSEPVREDSHRAFLQRFQSLGVRADQLSVCYAMAENVFAVTQTTLGHPPIVDWIDRDMLTSHQQAVSCAPEHISAVACVSCGRPIAGVQVRITDSRGQPLDERQVGEINIRGDSLMDGYYRRADLTPFSADGWYLTGDMGYIANGEVYLVGRSKDIIINAGKNIFPQDIEAIVNTIPGIHPGRVVVFGVPDAREGTELIAVIAEVDGIDSTQRKKVIQQIRQKVAQQSAVTVSYVELVEERWLIKTSSGKIARSANRDKWLEQRQL